MLSAMESSEKPAGETPRNPEPKKISCLLAGLLAVAVVVILALVAWFWFNRPIKPVELSNQEVVVVEEKISTLEEVSNPEEPAYEKGAREIILTERELNGLLNKNTDLGGQLKFSLGTDQVHARIDTDLDPDLPVMGGKKLKARARFLVGMIEGKPSLILDDLTVWGVSVPNDWLAGMKGKDLLSEVFGGGNGLGGIEDLQIEPGRLIIKLAE